VTQQPSRWRQSVARVRRARSNCTLGLHTKLGQHKRADQRVSRQTQRVRRDRWCRSTDDAAAAGAAVAAAAPACLGIHELVQLRSGHHCGTACQRVIAGTRAINPKLRRYPPRSMQYSSTMTAPQVMLCTAQPQLSHLSCRLEAAKHADFRAKIVMTSSVSTSGWVVVPDAEAGDGPV